MHFASASLQVTQKDLKNKKAQIDELAATTKQDRDEWKISSAKEREKTEKAQVLSRINIQALQLQLNNALRDQATGLASFEILEEQTRLNVGLESRLAQTEEDLKESVTLRQEVIHLRIKH